MSKSSRGKTHEKKFLGPNLGQNKPDSGRELGFLLLAYCVSFKVHRMMAWNNV